MRKRGPSLSVEWTLTRFSEHGAGALPKHLGNLSQDAGRQRTTTRKAKTKHRPIEGISARIAKSSRLGS